VKLGPDVRGRGGRSRAQGERREGANSAGAPVRRPIYFSRATGSKNISIPAHAVPARCVVLASSSTAGSLSVQGVPVGRALSVGRIRECGVTLCPPCALDPRQCGRCRDTRACQCRYRLSADSHYCWHIARREAKAASVAQQLVSYHQGSMARGSSRLAFGLADIPGLRKSNGRFFLDKRARIVRWRTDASGSTGLKRGPGRAMTFVNWPGIPWRKTMKPRTMLFAALFTCSTAWAQNSVPDAAADQAPPAASASAVAVDAAPAGDSGAKVCSIGKWKCKLQDQSLEPGTRCMCRDHPGVVLQ
jgi:hypothetical protein